MNAACDPVQRATRSHSLPVALFRSGDMFGEYTLLAFVGKGATGAVWRARRTDTGRTVVLKLVRPDRVLASGRRRAFEQLTAALTRVGRLEHPCLESIYGTVRRNDDGVFGLVREYVSGTPLRPVDPLAEPDVLERALQLVGALSQVLSFVHCHNLIHGNVKPENILVLPSTEKPQIKLLDWCWTMADLSRRTKASKAFIAPEVLAGQPKTPASDQWSAARILAEPRFHKKLPRPVDELLRRAMATSPEDRFASMDAFAAAVEDCQALLQSRSSTSMRSVRTDRADRSEAKTEDLESPPPRARDEATPNSGSIGAINPSRDRQDPDPPVRASDPTRRLKPTSRSASFRVRLAGICGGILIGGSTAALVLSMGGSRSSPPSESTSPVKPAPEPRVYESGARSHSGNGVSRYDADALQPLTHACEQGRGSACMEAGRLLETRSPPTRDQARARVHYLIGCDGGHALACARLSVMHREGLGGPVSTRHADMFGHRACSMGHRPSCGGEGLNGTD